MDFSVNIETQGLIPIGTGTTDFGNEPATILGGYPWLEPADIQACLVYASLLARHERIELFPTALAS